MPIGKVVNRFKMKGKHLIGKCIYKNNYINQTLFIKNRFKLAQVNNYTLNFFNYADSSVDMQKINKFLV